ncbi:zinc knuckle [Colletotrichum limetticola]|uniref:Zinc knuckle n=1 Tax=Colletotrichum limetticola TaxID=1209924 RepID=A0ABQ9PGI7_9PEZI|nr:zinc knuckle [Colletotrichum limetticola]
MATLWPQEQTWPQHNRENANQLSRHLQTALKLIDTANEHPLNPQAVRATLIATISLLAKETERKVTNTITALSSLGSSTWGVMTREMRMIYKGVAIPQMMYACSLWSNSGWGEMGYTKRALNRLQRLQARAARAMCGAYSATSCPALDVGMHLRPVEQQIWKHNIDTISRGQSANDTSTYHPSSLLRSSRDRVSTSPEARSRPKRNTDAAHIYTDGSGIDGQIGAAAVCTTIQQTRKSHMGDDTTSTVYVGELQGIVQALEMAQADKEKGNHQSRVFIHTDNQAPTRSSAKPKGKSGANVLKIIAEKTQALREQGLKVELA